MIAMCSEHPTAFYCEHIISELTGKAYALTGFLFLGDL